MNRLYFNVRTWRRVFVAALASLVLAANAVAEHETPLPLTQFDLIGFSENGRYFAYETYGFFGAEILGTAAVHVLDLAEKRWVIGSPVVVNATQHNHVFSDLRSQAREKASPLIDGLNITRPAIYAALIGDGESHDNGHILHFGIPSLDGAPMSEPFTLQLSDFDVQAAAPCGGIMDRPPRGFSLNLEHFGENSAVYQDGPLARSRGCPDEYRLMAVIVPYQDLDMAHAVALVSVRNIGSDGVQRSFVPVPLSDPILR